MHWEGPSEASGTRAARVLPSCFALLEACIEALALDTQVQITMLTCLFACPTTACPCHLSPLPANIACPYCLSLPPCRTA